MQHIVNGKEDDWGLVRKQYVTVVDSRLGSEGIWYKCVWEIDSVVGEGWILEGYIEFVPPPTPTKSP